MGSMNSKSFGIVTSRVDRLCGDICSYVCPQTWLNEARTNVGLSPTMGFLNENDSLAYFAMLVELLSGLSVGFFKTFKFSRIISWLFRCGWGKEGHKARNTLMF